MTKITAPYTLQVLTHEYLIEGNVAPDSSIHLPRPDEQGSPLTLNNAQIQSTRTPPAPARSCASFVCTGNGVIALIPHVDYTLLDYYGSWKQYRTAVNGVFYLGPYWMTGRLMIPSPGMIPSSIPAYDIRFGSMLPGSQWAGLTAPFALISNLWMQGWEAA